MYFFTATINSWKYLLINNTLKQAILNSLEWMDVHGRARTHAFVIMPNHIHILWSTGEGFRMEEAENALLSYTAHSFKKNLEVNHPQILLNYRSTQHDRDYHFWERRSHSLEIMSRLIAEQKLDYIHANPIFGKWNLVSSAEDYQYSSARFYLLNEKNFSFLRHYMDYI